MVLVGYSCRSARCVLNVLCVCSVPIDRSTPRCLDQPRGTELNVKIEQSQMEITNTYPNVADAISVHGSGGRAPFLYWFPAESAAMALHVDRIGESLLHFDLTRSSARVGSSDSLHFQSTQYLLDQYLDTLLISPCSWAYGSLSP